MSMFTHNKTNRGFSLINFKDIYDYPCSLQCSSRVGEYIDSLDRPGSSCLWLGVDDPKPKVMASEAHKVGLYTTQRYGWIDYTLPKEVQLHTRMHLDRQQVRGLVQYLQHWLYHGKLN